LSHVGNVCFMAYKPIKRKMERKGREISNTKGEIYGSLDL